MMIQFYFFLRLLKESFRDLIPIVLVILFFQLAIIQAVPADWIPTTVGMVIVGIGLAIFLQRLEIGIFPIGEELATNIQGRNPLLDGFGFIAFASLFPMITVMVYGIIVEKLHIKGDSELANEDEKQKVHKIHGSLEGVEDMSLSTINLDATKLRHSMNLSFSDVVVMVPNQIYERY
jgi:hypothetical protein